MTGKLDAIKARIRALIAKATSSEHDGEATTFMGKAQELMEKYQLELFDLGDDDPIGITRADTRFQRGPMTYKANVLTQLGYYYGCRSVKQSVIGSPCGDFYVELIGPESSRITAALMLDFVWQQVLDKASILAIELDVNKPQAIRKLANALVIRIGAEIRKRNAAGRPVDGTCFSIVVVDAVKAFYDKNYAHAEKTQHRKWTIDELAYREAHNISITTQINNPSDILTLSNE